MELSFSDILGKVILVGFTYYTPDGEFYAILSNPPYVTEQEFSSLEPELYFEPRGALVAKEEGVEFYKAIASAYKDSLKPGGFFAFEIGATQAPQLSAIAKAHDMSLDIIRDLSGNDRVAVLRRK